MTPTTDQADEWAELVATLVVAGLDQLGERALIEATIRRLCPTPDDRYVATFCVASILLEHVPVPGVHDLFAQIGRAHDRQSVLVGPTITATIAAAGTGDAEGALWAWRQLTPADQLEVLVGTIDAAVTAARAHHLEQTP
jgi:hypothetical protein